MASSYVIYAFSQSCLPSAASPPPIWSAQHLWGHLVQVAPALQQGLRIKHMLLGSVLQALLM